MSKHLPSLSVVLIAKNEANQIDECLKMVQPLADEIIILDSGSTDNTLEIAKQYTDKIYIHSDWQGFGKQRQIAQSYASGDWVLMLDVDERITPELANEIKNVITANNQSHIYAIPRLSWAFGDFIRHSGWYPDYVLRLYPNTKTHYNDALVHEKLKVPKDMQVVKLKNQILHYTYQNLEHYLTKSASYAKAWATQRFSQGKKTSLFQGVGHGVWCFLRMYFFKFGFFDGKQGLLLALLSAHSVFAKYAALWVMHQPDKKD